MGDETENPLPGLPLLEAPDKKIKKQAWGGGDVKEMSDFAAASAVIASTFSSETRSTVSSDLYHTQRSPKEERFEYPIAKAMEKSFETEGKPQNGSHHQSKNARAGEPKPSVPSFSISGSMLCSNIEQGRIKEDSTAAANKISKPHRATGLPPTAVAASSLFRSMQLEEHADTTKNKNRGPMDRKVARHNLYGSVSADSIDEEDSPYVTIKHCDSKDGAQSSVSSVTMYSSYQNDPMYRASNNLLDILRSNKFENFTEETTSQALFEA